MMHQKPEPQPIK